jgi:hypothetical protein
VSLVSSSGLFSTGSKASPLRVLQRFSRFSVWEGDGASRLRDIVKVDSLPGWLEPITTDRRFLADSGQVVGLPFAKEPLVSSMIW